MLDARHCQLNELHQCAHCGRQFKHARVVAMCPKGDSSAIHSPIKPIVLNSMLAMIREKKFCSGCEFFRPDRGTEEPICALLECGCGASKTPEEKAMKLSKKWATHLANTTSRCLLPGKPKFGTMLEMHEEELKTIPDRLEAMKEE